MAKKNLLSTESKKRTADMETIEVEFLQATKHVAKGQKATIGIDTAVGLCVRGIAKMTTEAGKKVMAEVNAEEKEIEIRRKEIKDAQKS